MRLVDNARWIFVLWLPVLWLPVLWLPVLWLPVLWLPVLWLFWPSTDAAGQSPVIDYGTEVRPILARHCFKCHGPDPDTREAGLRLDESESATADLGGYAAIVPGDPDASELIDRIVSSDADLRMPPIESGPSLSEAEIEVLRRWIVDGAAYATHWAFERPHQVEVPDVKYRQWCRGVIDRFVLQRMETHGLTPAMPADRQRLIRRLYLDLTGTSPSWDEVERFVNDRHPAAERKLIDRLLASPEYGERFARSWLDLARYSDTNGYEKDRPRSIWPYRDWVIDALNEDLPYNQFSIEQLAGDMLPGASQSQRIATGFHRNTMLNEEGGIDPLEYRYYALVDRVATTGTVWMGMTIGCAQCHTHKYDPITQHDYFALMALLNQANEPDLIVDDTDRDQRSSVIEQQIEAAVENLASQLLPTFDVFRQGAVGESDTAISFRAWVQRQLDQSRTWMTVRPLN